MIRFFAKGRCAHCVSDDKLTKGSVGIEVRFYLEDWDAAPNRVVVFRAGSTKVDVALLTDRCTVPPEVLNNPGDMLVIGVYGTDNDSNIVIPTVYADAGRVRLGAAPSGIEPTPTTQPLIDQLVAAAEEAERVAQSVRDDADNGSFDGSDGVSPVISSESITGGHRLTIVDADGTTTVDVMDGADGNSIWWTVSLISDESMAGQVYGKIRSSWLKGRVGTPAVHDLVVGPAVGTSGSIVWLYEINSVAGIYCNLKGIGSIKGAPGDPGEDGADGYSPVVTITEITGGHRVTITDEEHPQGQSFDVMDGQGGSGTGDYDDLTNKPQIAGVTLSGNKSLADLGIAAASDIPTVPVQSVNGKTGAVVLNASDVGAGTYTKPSGGIPASDLASAVQTSLGKADTALQSAPVTSVNGQTGAVSLSIPSTAADVGAVAANQGIANANKVLTVNSSGVVVPEDNRFVVTCTPTSQDLSGVMDKTVAEIDAAYGAGKQVFFRVYVGTDYIETNVTSGGSGSGGYPSFNGFFITNAPYDAAVNLWTGTGASGNTQTYNAKIYPLASGQWTGGSY